MNFDWNWFFSSFCQSAAALIGIIAAFIISRLLGLSEKINNVLSEFDNLQISRSKLLASISNRHFYWYTRISVEYDDDLTKGINLYGQNKEEIISKIYETKKTLYKIDEAVWEAVEEKKKMGHSTQFPLLRPTPNGLWDRLREERELIEQLEIEAKTIIRHFQQNLQQVNAFRDSIKPLRIIIVMLMIAFVLTVIYPLHFMPVNANSSPSVSINPIAIFKTLFTIKSILLFFFFATIEGIFYYFLILTDQLHKTVSDAVTRNLEDFRNIKMYSQHFEEA